MRATIQFISKELNDYYPESEIQSLIRLIIEHVCHLSYTEFVLKKIETLDSSTKKKVEKIVERLKHLEPIQYILGETEFFGMRFEVTPAVLIPRQETEELVQWIIKMNKLKDPYILDIGTGSGCIALVLKNKIKAASVSALDISKEALDIARHNALVHNLDVNFFRADILNFKKYNWHQYDLIVSNPPYVRELEKKQMSDNVIQYEPAKALFVPDDDPLIFYRGIGEFSKKYLRKNGMLFFEINEKFGSELTIWYRESGFKDIELVKDLHGKDRFLKCTKQ